MDRQQNLSSTYLKELIKWNKKINLVSKNDASFLYNRHYLDSLEVEKYICQHSTILDLGSGNGFPSIPLAIKRNDLKITSMDISSKKVYFLNHIKKIADLSNYNIICSRIESFPKELESKFDLIISRAFKSVVDIIKLSLFYGHLNYKIIIFNSFYINELHRLSTHYQKLIHNVENIVYKLEDNIERTFCIIDIKKSIEF